MTLRSNSHVMAIGADHYFIHNYIRSLLNIILNIFYLSEQNSNPRPTTCVSDTLAN